jgi:hypothetical protein
VPYVSWALLPDKNKVPLWLCVLREESEGDDDDNADSDDKPLLTTAPATTYLTTARRTMEATSCAARWPIPVDAMLTLSVKSLLRRACRILRTPLSPMGLLEMSRLRRLQKRTILPWWRGGGRERIFSI